MLMTLALALTNGLFGSDFDLDIASLAPRDSEYSAEKAYSRVRQLITDCKIRDRGYRPRLRLEEYRGRRTWEYETEGGAWFKLDAGSGALLHFSGEATDLGTDRADSVAPCKSLYESDEKLRDRLIEVARAAGLPEDAVLDKVSNGNVAKNGVFTPFGTAQFRLVKKGRSVLGRFGDYSVDLRDGVAVEINQSYDYDVRDEEPTLELASALVTAEAGYVAELARLKVSSRFVYDPSKPGTLVYGAVDGKSSRTKTIAWSIFFGDDHVIVDATSGQCLGIALSPRRG